MAALGYLLQIDAVIHRPLLGPFSQPPSLRAFWFLDSARSGVSNVTCFGTIVILVALEGVRKVER